MNWKERMNILLVRPKPHKESIGLQSFMICEPLELEYLCSALEAAGHRVTIVDMLLERKPLAHFVRELRPRIVGFTSYITHVHVVKDYARIVKAIDPDCVTVVGGVHAEVMPQDFEDPSIDAVARVNGLKAMTAIAEHVEQGGSADELRALPGVWNGPGKDYTIDTRCGFQPPNREATAKYRKRYHYAFHQECATLKTSFGCPFNCTFCFCVQVTQHRYFERDLPSVIEELRSIRERTVFIVDDNFLLKCDRVLEFCRRVREAGIDKRYIVFGRADFIAHNEDVISAIAEIGVTGVFVGIETFKEDELARMEKRSTVEMSVRAVLLLEKYGIECYGGILVGRDWDDNDFDTLIAWFNAFKQPILNIQPLTPIPGTPLYDKYAGEIAVPRERYEYWDLTHLLLPPTRISPSRFYANILKTYLRTSASLRGHRYILARYGWKAYLRCLYGSMVIIGQYLKLILRPGLPWRLHAQEDTLHPADNLR